MTVWLLLKRVTDSCLLLYNQHHPNQLSPWAADSELHFYSDCADDGARQANASWTSIASVRAHWAHLRDLWKTLPLPSMLYSRLNLLPSGCLPKIRGKYCRGETSSLCFIQSSWQTGKKAAGYSSSPYLLFRTQHKSPGESEPIVLVTNRETSSAIIYIKFGRIKGILPLRMQSYAEVGSVVSSHSFHDQLTSGVSVVFSAATKLLMMTFQALTPTVFKSHFKTDFLLNKCAIKSTALITDW